MRISSGNWITLNACKENRNGHRVKSVQGFDYTDTIAVVRLATSKKMSIFFKISAGGLVNTNFSVRREEITIGMPSHRKVKFAVISISVLI